MLQDVSSLVLAFGAAPQEGISVIIDAETPTLEQVQNVILAQSKDNFWRPVPKDTSVLLHWLHVPN